MKNTDRALAALIAMRRMIDEKNLKIPKTLQYKILVNAELMESADTYYLVTDKTVSIGAYAPPLSKNNVTDILLDNHNEISVKSRLFKTIDEASVYAKSLQKNSYLIQYDEEVFTSPLILRLKLTLAAANKITFNPMETTKLTSNDLLSNSIEKIHLPNNCFMNLPIDNIPDITTVIHKPPVLKIIFGDNLETSADSLTMN